MAIKRAGTGKSTSKVQVLPYKGGVAKTTKLPYKGGTKASTSTLPYITPKTTTANKMTKKSTPISDGIGYTKTSKNRSTGAKTTTTGRLASVTKDEFASNGRMTKKATPINKASGCNKARAKKTY